jgi:small subunit ribosomal protein S8e
MVERHIVMPSQATAYKIGMLKILELREKAKTETKRSRHLAAKLKQNAKGRFLQQIVADQFSSGRLLACISSRPGQSGRCDGYILEGKELEFYQRKLEKKKK